MSLFATFASKDFRVIGTIGLAHGISHFFHMAIPPLFLLLSTEFNVSYTALGLIMTLFAIASCTTQFFSGMLVDRIGAWPVLASGLFLLAGGTLACALAPNMMALYVPAIFMGIGNGVFHPCDFAVMNANIEERRLGYAYALHGVSGNVGWALAPITSYAFSTHFGWRSALLAMGIVGLLVLVLLLSQRRFLNSETTSQVASKSGAPPTRSRWLQRATLLCFLFLLMQASVSISVSSFTPSILHESFALSPAFSTLAVTVYLWASALGVLVGGVVAARASRHVRVAVGGLVAAALSAFPIFFVMAWPVLLLSCFALFGFAVGMIGPSRDMIVRSVTPKGASGRVYGFVYSGADVGFMVAPLLVGWMIDHGVGRGVYMALSGLLLLAILTATSVSQPPGRRSASP
ncbi:MAG: MFS transporter [Cystobacterineae bacterium]|nr:MFS transporter [Cystobacterineae bacterium]